MARPQQLPTLHCTTRGRWALASRRIPGYMPKAAQAQRAPSRRVWLREREACVAPTCLGSLMLVVSEGEPLWAAAPHAMHERGGVHGGWWDRSAVVETLHPVPCPVPARAPATLRRSTSGKS